MPHINFAEALAEKSEPIAAPPIPSIFTEPPISVMESAYVEPAKFRRSRIGRSEWVNLSCAALAIAGGVFSAFYFFNAAELFRSALAWPRELLYPRPLAADRFMAGGGAVIPPMARPSPKTDPSGDPFPRAGGPLTLDRPLYTLARESSNGPGGSSTIPPSIPGIPTPPGNPGIPGVPGVPGLPGGHLPGPATLISRLSLLVPGADHLTQALQRAAADLQKNITVTVRHDVSRVVNASRVVRRSRLASRVISTANGGRMLVHGAVRKGERAGQTVSTATTSVSNSGSGSGMSGGNAGLSGSGATGSGLGGTAGLGGLGTIGGGGRSVLGGLGGAVGGVVGGVGGLTGGSHGGGGGGRH